MHLGGLTNLFVQTLVFLLIQTKVTHLICYKCMVLLKASSISFLRTHINTDSHQMASTLWYASRSTIPEGIKFPNRAQRQPTVKEQRFLDPILKRKGDVFDSDLFNIDDKPAKRRSRVPLYKVLLDQLFDSSKTVTPKQKEQSAIIYNFFMSRVEPAIRKSSCDKEGKKTIVEQVEEVPSGSTTAGGV